AEREGILPLLDDVTLEGRMRNLAGVAGLRVPDLEQARLSLLDDADDLTRNLAVATWPENIDARGDRARRAYAETYRNMLSPVDIVLLLKSVPLFERLTTRHLMDLAGAMHEERFEEGTDVCREGEIGNCMYLIVSGRVGLRSGTTRLAQMGARDFFGEMALFDGITRSATVTAEDAVHVLRLDRNDLLHLMDELPAIAIAICQSLSERLREMNRKAAETNPAEIAND
ncbi:MAG: cyclic nucleotide-binding domain-containing protein, partial [Myxococcota bacterium]